MEGQGKRSIMQEAGAIEREALRFGLHRVKSDLIGSHPLESSYRSRPTGAIPSSMLGLEAFMGNLDNSGFEDYLNDTRESKCFRLLDMLHGMEDRLGISKGPVFPSVM